jgi:hypothetical protein
MHFMFSIFSPVKSCRLRHNVATGDNIIRCTRFACWIGKATDNHSEWLTRIGFPFQHWFPERSLMFCYTYNASLVRTKFRYAFLISCMLLVLHVTSTSLPDIFLVSFLISSHVSALGTNVNLSTLLSDILSLIIRREFL